MSAKPTIKFMPPLKGEDSPRRGEMSAQPTEWGVEVGRHKPSRRGLSEWRVKSGEWSCGAAHAADLIQGSPER